METQDRLDLEIHHLQEENVFFQKMFQSSSGEWSELVQLALRKNSEKRSVLGNLLNEEEKKAKEVSNQYIQLMNTMEEKTGGEDVCDCLQMIHVVNDIYE